MDGLSPLDPNPTRRQIEREDRVRASNYAVSLELERIREIKGDFHRALAKARLAATDNEATVDDCLEDMTAYALDLCSNLEAAAERKHGV